MGVNDGGFSKRQATCSVRQTNQPHTIQSGGAGASCRLPVLESLEGVCVAAADGAGGHLATAGGHLATATLSTGIL